MIVLGFLTMLIMLAAVFSFDKAIVFYRGGGVEYGDRARDMYGFFMIAAVVFCLILSSVSNDFFYFYLAVVVALNLVYGLYVLAKKRKKSMWNSKTY